MPSLEPGAVTVSGQLSFPPHAGSGVVGSPPQWADGNDGTYAHIQRKVGPDFTGTDTASAALPALAGTVLQVDISLRARSLVGSGTTQVGVQVYTPTVGFAESVFAVPVGGGATTYTQTADLLDNPADWMNLPGLVVDVKINQPLNSAATIYEVGIFVTLEGAKPLRLYPRDDGLGMSSAARIYPRPKADRIIGGYQ